MSIAKGNKNLAATIIRSGSAVPLYEHILCVPILSITTEGGAPIVSKEDYLNAAYELSNTSGSFSLTGQIRGRGNSTWDQPKKAYKLKFDSKQRPLGLTSKEKNWDVLANYMDHSMIRNAIALEIGKHTSLAWTPEYTYIEIILNGVPQGIYQMTDHVEVKSDRLDIDEMEEIDIDGLALTGGYSMEIDVRMEENNEPGFRTRMNVPVTLDEPDGSVQEQMDYIHDWIQTFEDVLFSDTFTDPTDGYAKYVDVNSFIDWYLVNEMLANNDSGFGASVKLYKTRDTDTTPGKLYLGPLWDFDLSIGIGAVYPVHDPQQWWTRNGATWIARMLEDPAFVATMKSRWAALKSSLVTNNYLYDFIDQLNAKLDPAITRDEAIWNYNRNSGMTTVTFIKTWLQTRFAWIDSEFASPADTTPPTTPTGLASTYASAYQITLEWDAATDTGGGLGVTGYRIWQDGAIAAQTAIPYSDTLTSVTIGNGLAPNTAYTFTVQARDATGNWSAHSDPLVASTASSADVGNGLSIFLNDAPVTTNAGVYDDGNPITLGTVFYTFGQYSTGRSSIGGRIYIPSTEPGNHLTAGQHVKIGIWTDFVATQDVQVMFDPSTEPTKSAIGTITTGDSWVEVLWDTPVPLTPGKPVLIGYQFVETPNVYLFGRLTSNDNYAPNLTASPGLWLSSTVDLYAPTNSQLYRSYLRYDGAGTIKSDAYFGTDILVDEPS